MIYIGANCYENNIRFKTIRSGSCNEIGRGDLNWMAIYNQKNIVVFKGLT